MLTVWELPGCELFDRQPDSLIHLHTHPSQSAWHTAGGEWVKAEVWIVPDSWFHLCSLEKRFLLGLWGVTFFPKLVLSTLPSQGWAQTNLQGLGNPEPHRQTLLGLAKSGSRKIIHTKWNSLWPQQPTQLSPKGVASAVTHVCLRGSNAALCGGWEQGGREGVGCH